jgi:hypothetical protein
MRKFRTNSLFPSSGNSINPQLFPEERNCDDGGGRGGGVLMAWR